jgi:hypothetical protein
MLLLPANGYAHRVTAAAPPQRTLRAAAARGTSQPWGTADGDGAPRARASAGV